MYREKIGRTFIGTKREKREEEIGKAIEKMRKMKNDHKRVTF